VFYGTHQNRFFKDRHWLGVEFPELTTIREGAASHTVLEVGCGVGNTVFPLLTQVEDPRLFVWACDFSATAVSIVQVRTHACRIRLPWLMDPRCPQGSELYDTRRCKAFVCDIANEDIADTVPKASVDVVSMIFVLSALRPDKFAAALRRIYDVLKPGGLLIFRDYGRYDLAQLRFKPRAVIADNFYVRGDGTRVYFFAEGEEDVALSWFILIEKKNRRAQAAHGRWRLRDRAARGRSPSHRQPPASSTDVPRVAAGQVPQAVGSEQQQQQQCNCTIGSFGILLYFVYPSKRSPSSTSASKK